jgi:hypothetical protein
MQPQMPPVLPVAEWPIRPLRTHALIAVLGLGVVVVCDLVARLLLVHVFELSRQLGPADGALEAASPIATQRDVELRVVILLMLGSSVVAAVAFIAWLYRARTNLGSGLRFGRGLAIGSWGIPFVWVALPMFVVGEVDRYSDERAAAASGGAPLSGGWRWLRLAAWWLGYLAFRLVEFAVPAVMSALARASGDTGGLRMIAVLVNGLAFTTVLVAALLAVLVIRRITLNQERFLPAAAR